MNASDLFRAGKLREAIDTQLQAVKANPADPGKRVFLFELLIFASDLDRAQRQLDAVNFRDAERDATVLIYRKLLDVERARGRVFREGLKPQFLTPPPEHVGLRLEALTRLREGRLAEAAELLDRANEAIPPLHGQLNGKDFSSLRDGDDSCAGILEVMTQDGYFWVPLEQVASLALSPPQFPRDILWMPARLQLQNELGGKVFLPGLYWGTHEQPEELLKVGQATDWKMTDDGPVIGVGARVFLVDGNPVPLVECRQLELRLSETPPPG